MIRAPFFEIGPKNYVYGDEVLRAALCADRAAERYGVDVIFTTPYADIRIVAESTKHLHVFAPHMDAAPVGRGLANVLPESLRAAGAEGVMLNHAERPLTEELLELTMRRAGEAGLQTIVCADSVSDMKRIAALKPDLIVAEPADLIGTGQTADDSYVSRAVSIIKEISPDTGVLVAAGIKGPDDVYRMMRLGADATGSSSGIFCSEDPEGMIELMIEAARRGWDDGRKGEDGDGIQ